MSFARTIPNYLRRRREKVFGDGRPQPLDREAKLRIMTRARALKQRTEKGKHYGLLDRQMSRRAGGAVMEFPQCAQRALLPVAGEDCREGQSRALDRLRGD